MAIVLTALIDDPPPCHTALVPAYVPAAELARLAESPARRRMVIMNPMNGPGAAHDRGYADAVRALRDVGTKVLGYVATGYGRRPVADVERDIERYAAWYGVDGVFLDEASSGVADVEHYRALAEHARATTGGPVVLNPGVFPDRAYFGLADIVVTFEGDYAHYEAAAAQAPDGEMFAGDRRAHLVYAATREQALRSIGAAGAVQFLYFTSGDRPNPWGELPAYLVAEQDALNASTPRATNQGRDACAWT